MSHDKSRNVYSVYEAGTGQISMSNKVFDDPDGRYGKVLHEREMNFLNHAGETHAQLDEHYVWNGDLSMRPIMTAKLDKTRISPGGVDGTTIRGVPKGAQLTIFAGDIQFFSETIDSTKVELSAPVPGVYTVVLQKWPYRDWRAEVLAQ